jgi:hypothetical protein
MPSGLAYGLAVQHPSLAFAGDAVLATATPVPGMFGQPKAFSGNFAIVFQLTATDGQLWAAKCFTRDVAHRHERYEAIHQLLHSIERPWEVPFEYRPAGIEVEGARHPLVRMAWIDATTLGTFLRDEQVSDDEVAAVSRSFLEVVASLDVDGIAHGDLQHGNILVDRERRVRLVDYDGMFVPAIAHLGAAENGHPGYQSPKRTRAHFDATLDRHSAWVVHLALRVRALAPSLFVEMDVDDDGLLLTAEDLSDPTAGRVLERLVEAGGELKDLAHDLVEVLGREPGDVPAFEPPTPGIAAGSRCRTRGSCDVCATPLCRLCDGGGDRCGACDYPTRSEVLDRPGAVAWKLGGDAVLHIGRRVASLSVAGQVRETWVTTEDHGRDARNRVRRYAAHLGLPLDVGVVQRAPTRVEPDGPFEWVVPGGQVVSVSHDPSASSVKVVAEAAKYLDVEGTPTPTVGDEATSVLSELIARLRRRVRPPSPGQLTVEVEQDITRVRLVPEGLRWRRERRTADGVILVLGEGEELWGPAPKGLASDPHRAVARTRWGGLEATLYRVNASLMVEMAGQGTKSVWFVAGGPDATYESEAALARHLYLTGRSGAVIAVHGRPDPAPNYARRSSAELVTRVTRTILVSIPADDPRISSTPRSPREDDLRSLGLKPAGAATGMGVVRGSAAALFIEAASLMVAPQIEHHVTALEVVETWRGSAERTIRYTAHDGELAGPTARDGARLVDFTVDEQGEFVELGVARPCAGCATLTVESDLRPCGGCSLPSRCASCGPSETIRVERCAECDHAVCYECDRGARTVACAICEAPLCRSCIGGGWCAPCDVSGWAPWTESLPDVLRSNRLRVVGRRSGGIVRALLIGTRRRELVVLVGEELRRWVSVAPEGAEALHLAGAWRGTSDLAFDVRPEEITAAPERTGASHDARLVLAEDRRFAVRWRLRSGYNSASGEVALWDEPSVDIDQVAAVRAAFGLAEADAGLDPALRTTGPASPDPWDPPEDLADRIRRVVDAGPAAPDDAIELRLHREDHHLAIDGGGLTVDGQPVANWAPAFGTFEPWSAGTEMAHLAASWNNWRARLWRLRSTVVLEVADEESEDVRTWFVTGSLDELTEFGRGCRWLDQAGLIRIEDRVTPEECRTAGFEPFAWLAQDPSRTCWEVPLEDDPGVAAAMATVELDGLSLLARREISMVAYSQLTSLPEVPLVLGAWGTFGGRPTERWPDGVAPPLRRLEGRQTSASPTQEPPPASLVHQRRDANSWTS